MWLSTVPITFAALVLLILPGYLALSPLLLNRFRALCFAPAISISLISVGAFASPLLGRHWSWAVALLTLASTDVLLLTRHHVLQSAERETTSRRWWSHVIAAGLAFAIVALNYRLMVKHPTAFSNTWDNAFHLSTTRHIWESGEASSLWSSSYLYAGHPSSFYPSAFHDFAAVVLHLNHGQMTTSIHAAVVVIMGFAWPMAVLGGVDLLWKLNNVELIGVGIVSVACPTFPYYLADFGVLYPNLLGLAFAPLLIGLLASLYSVGAAAPLSRPCTLILLAGVVPGIALAHPSALIAVLVFSIPLSIFGISHGIREIRTDLWSGGSLLALAALHLIIALGAWYFLHPAIPVDYIWPRFSTTAQGITQAWLSVPISHHLVTLLFALLVAIGFIGLLMTKRLFWMGLGCTLIVAIYVVMVAAPAKFLRWIITRAWYEDYYRFSAVVGVISVLMACYGWHLFITTAIRHLPASCTRRGYLVFGATSCVLLLLLTQSSGGLREEIRLGHSAYQTPIGPLDGYKVTAAEYELLSQAAMIIPEGQTVANVPGTGSEFLYSLFNRDVLIPYYAYSVPDADQIYLAHHLREAATNPLVCSILNSQNIHYALDFGPYTTLNIVYSGWVDIASTPGFETVAAVGEKRLLKIVACG
ncbi:MAG: DUF6541 family protein [Propionibacteriaceae bacterium]